MEAFADEVGERERGGQAGRFDAVEVDEAGDAVRLGALHHEITRGRAGPLEAADLTALYLLLTVLWVAAAGNWLELGENDRFRFMTEPLALALLGWLLAGARPRPQPPGPREPGVVPSGADALS